MNAETSETQDGSASKGKARALEPTEQTPLLGHASRSPPLVEDSQPTTDRRTFWRRVGLTFLLFVAASAIALIVTTLLARSYAAQLANVSPEQVLREAVVFSGPDRIDVLNVTADGGLWVQVEGWIGVDAGKVIHVDSDPDNDGFWSDIWKSIGRWGIQRLGFVTIDLSTITVRSTYDPSVTLATINTSTVELLLTADPPPNQSWLSKLSIPILLVPTHNSSDIVEFLRESWRHEFLSVVTEIPEVRVRGGTARTSSWRARLHREELNVKTPINLKIPPLPGLPSPGRHSPFPSISQLLTLKSFNISASASNSSLAISAIASVIDPAPANMKFTTPPLPFIISLPDGKSSIPIASVETAPFSLTHPNITLNISGTVLPLPSSRTPVLSTFLDHYLSSEPNPIIITSPIFPGISVDTLFPAPYPRPRVLRNVTIHNMRIIPVGKSFLASGTVFAHIVLPKGTNIDLDVKRVLPDVLVFDGEVPDDVGIPTRGAAPPAPDLPDPLPAKAFGHIRPDDWLDAESKPVDSEDGEGAAFAVSANIVDVPIKVLPGRQKEFSNFVGKVIFGTGGAVAGILGEAAVAVEVSGLPIDGGTGSGEMELNGLPFKGSVRIHKRTFFEGRPSIRELHKFMRAVKRILQVGLELL
ncbi:hypothetical protein HGRIS_012142 [Hohenbuehelia grisea]|uniref:Uncharacterized protein n=1 Tax=Hohenbuehelia grisea TaxID=104357 RepID=A0ABR3IRD4_9AGAR